MEYHGDWGLKLFPSFNPDGTPLLDKDGNQVFHTRFDPRYPPFTNLERDPNGRPDLGETGPVTGSMGPITSGSASSAARDGDRNGRGRLFRGLANVPNFIIGDDPENLKTGNDTIEGGENLRPYSAPGFTREGEHIEGIGDDILFGGPGDDDIYADRIAPWNRRSIRGRRRSIRKATGSPESRATIVFRLGGARRAFRRRWRGRDPRRCGQ